MQAQVKIFNANNYRTLSEARKEGADCDLLVINFVDGIPHRKELVRLVDRKLLDVVSQVSRLFENDPCAAGIGVVIDDEVWALDSVQDWRPDVGAYWEAEEVHAFRPRYGYAPSMEFALIKAKSFLEEVGEVGRTCVVAGTKETIACVVERHVVCSTI